MQPKPHVCASNQGKTLAALGVSLVYKVPSEITAGKWSMLEYTAPPRFEGPAPHLHRIMEETFYVLEGTLTLQAGNETIDAQEGTVVVVPPGVVHKFSNRSEHPVRFMLLMTPGGFEGYFEELIELRKSAAQWPPADPMVLKSLMERYDTYAPGS